MAENEAAAVEKPYQPDDAVHLFLAYFGILSLVPFFMFRDQRADPKKEYVYWHARQGLAFTVSWLVVVIIALVGSTALGFIPVLGRIVHLFMCFFWPVFSILPLVVTIFCWTKAFGGEKWAIPGISKIAEMFN